MYTLENGEKEIKVTLKGNEQLEVTGLPEGATYTIDESGTDAIWFSVSGSVMCSVKSKLSP